MNLNINVDSFRAMVGVKNEGAVHIGKNGGLEKINTGFFARNIDFCRTKTSATENGILRRAFLSSLAETGISDGLYREIQFRLGVSGRLNANETQGNIGDALSRAEIAEIFELVDNENLKLNDAATSTVAREVREGGAAGLRKIVDRFNSRYPGDAIKVSDRELAAIFRSHGREFEGIAAFAHRLGVGGVDGPSKGTFGILQRIREIVQHRHEKLDPTTALSYRAITANTGSGGKWNALRRLGIKETLVGRYGDASLDWKQPGMRLGREAFTPISFLSLSKSSRVAGFEAAEKDLKAKDPKASAAGLRVNDGAAKAFVELAREELLENGGNNCQRNSYNVSVNGRKFMLVSAPSSQLDMKRGSERIDRFADWALKEHGVTIDREKGEIAAKKGVDPKDLSKGEIDTLVREYNKKLLGEIFDEILKLKPSMSVGELFAATKFANQTVTNAPVGLKMGFDCYKNKTFELTLDAKKHVNVALTQREGGEGVRDFEMKYEVHDSGLAQFTSLGLLAD